MNKKADMSINVIIVAAIALVVLVVLIAIFTGKIGVFNQGVSDTPRGDLCRYDGKENTNNVYYRCETAKGTGSWTAYGPADKVWLDCGKYDSGLAVKCMKCTGTAQTCGLQ